MESLIISDNLLLLPSAESVELFKLIKNNNLQNSLMYRHMYACACTDIEPSHVYALMSTTLYSDAVKDYKVDKYKYWFAVNILKWFVIEP